MPYSRRTLMLTLIGSAGALAAGPALAFLALHSGS
jgi:hypothetical protein